MICMKACVWSCNHHQSMFRAKCDCRASALICDSLKIDDQVIWQDCAHTYLTMTKMKAFPGNIHSSTRFLLWPCGGWHYFCRTNFDQYLAIISTVWVKNNNVSRTIYIDPRILPELFYKKELLFKLIFSVLTSQPHTMKYFIFCACEKHEVFFTFNIRQSSVNREKW